MSNFEEEQKDREMVMLGLRGMRKRGSDTKAFLWQMMCFETEYEMANLKKEEIEEIEGKDCESKENESNDTNDTNETLQISQLTDDTNEEMCVKGHGGEVWKDWGIGDNKCVQCGSVHVKERKYCEDCVLYEGFDTIPKHIYCIECRKSNSENIRNALKMDRFKAQIIREELVKNPYLEMDLLCAMPRKASLDTLLRDINRLEPYSKRVKWCLIAFDLDHLKAWNDCLGHVCADKLIKKIGNIMNKYVREVNDGKWCNESDRTVSFRQAFVYRPGGDEFVMVLKCSSYAMDSKLGVFYTKLKREINCLGANIKQFTQSESEWTEVQKRLETAKDRKGNSLNMSNVGISTGVFVSDTNVRDKDWLVKADMALEHAKSLNLPNKNSIAIYDEKSGGLVSDEKVQNESV